MEQLAAAKRKATSDAPRLSLPDWMGKYRALLKPGLAFDLNEHPYLRDIYADNCREMVLLKAGQMGISEYLLSWMLWNADVNTMTGLYVFPTESHVSDFSAARLGAAIDSSVSPYLASIIVAAGSGEGQRGADRVGLKRVRDRFIYFRGATVKADDRAAQLKSIDADALVLDEYDEMDIRAPAIAVERLGHSPHKLTRLASTPTYPNVGIHAEYLSSDQRQYHLRCACGNWQAPDLADVILAWDVLERPLRWHTRDGLPFIACKKCGEPLDSHGAGEWVAAQPTQERHGYHVHGLLSPRRTLAEIIGEHRAEKSTGLMAVDESTRKVTLNQKVGVPHKPLSAVSLTDEILDKCKREYMLGPQPGGAFCGVDVGRVYHVVIRGADWGLRYADAVANLQAVSELLAAHGVLSVTIDALPETHLVREFQLSKARDYIWLAYYRERGKDIPPYEWDGDKMTVTADRTRTLDATLGSFRRAAAGEAGATLPANARDIPDYYAHLKALERKLQPDAMGNTIAVYVEHGADHFAHAENYCYLAAAYWMSAANKTQSVVSYAPVQIGRW